jgi:hypothetical protein
VRKDGDPVDLATGLFVYEKMDLALADMIPTGIRRTYRQNDPTSRPFGMGVSHDYELHLLGERLQYTYAELLLADGGRIRYDRISSGTGFANAIMEHTATPTRFTHNAKGSVIGIADPLCQQTTLSYNGSGLPPPAAR